MEGKKEKGQVERKKREEEEEGKARRIKRRN